MRIITIVVMLGFWAVLPETAMAENKPPIHHLKLKKVESVKLGKVAAVSGQTNKQGVRLALYDTKSDQPLQVTLVSLDRGKQLTLGIYRRSWSKPKMVVKTGKDGSVTYRYRSGRHTGFIVTGPKGAQYQLVLWVGPAAASAPKNAISSMKAYEKKFGPQPKLGPVKK